MRQGLRVVEQYGIEVGTVVEFTAAMLAQRQDSEAARLFARIAFRERGIESDIERLVREIRQAASDILEAPGAREIGDGRHQRHTRAMKAQPLLHARGLCPFRFGLTPGGVRVALRKQPGDRRETDQHPCQKRRVRLGARERVRPIRTGAHRRAFAPVGGHKNRLIGNAANAPKKRNF